MNHRTTPLAWLTGTPSKPLRDHADQAPPACHWRQRDGALAPQASAPQARTNARSTTWRERAFAKGTPTP